MADATSPGSAMSRMVGSRVQRVLQELKQVGPPLREREAPT